MTLRETVEWFETTANAIRGDRRLDDPGVYEDLMAVIAASTLTDLDREKMRAAAHAYCGPVRVIA